MKIASLCTGSGALELALTANLVSVAETDKFCKKYLSAKHPTIPNYGSITEIDYLPNADEIDIITAGFPCNPVSQAGKKLAQNDKRWLISDVVRIWERSAAPWLIMENVYGLYSAQQGRAFEEVIDALAKVGATARWTYCRASDVGAPHHRKRWYCVAYRDSFGLGPGARPRPSTTPQFRWDGSCHDHPENDSSPRQEITEVFGTKYHHAIARWECVLQRKFPHPTDPDSGRLSAEFCEWMMGLPQGYVTNPQLGLSRLQQIKILGNAVVPQQATYALEHLIREL